MDKKERLAEFNRSTDERRKLINVKVQQRKEKIEREVMVQEE